MWKFSRREHGSQEFKRDLNHVGLAGPWRKYRLVLNEASPELEALKVFSQQSICVAQNHLFRV
jgi:hypothetical protein